MVCVCACDCLPRSVFVSAGEGAPSYSTAVASGLLVGGFAVTWACTAFSSGVKVPANVQRNINGKPAPQKRRRQPLCRALRCSVQVPSFGKKTGARLDLDWPELEPDCPGRPTDKQQHSINLGRPGLDKLTTDNSNRDPFLFALAFSKFGHILSITNSSVHPPTRHPTARLWLLLVVTRDRSSQFSTYLLHHHRSHNPFSVQHTVRCCLPITAAVFYINFSSRPSLLCRSSSSSLPRPPLPAVPHVALGCHEASRPQSIDGTPGLGLWLCSLLCNPPPTQHKHRRAQRELRLG